MTTIGKICNIFAMLGDSDNIEYLEPVSKEIWRYGDLCIDDISNGDYGFMRVSEFRYLDLYWIITKINGVVKQISYVNKEINPKFMSTYFREDI